MSQEKLFEEIGGSLEKANKMQEFTKPLKSIWATDRFICRWECTGVQFFRPRDNHYCRVKCTCKKAGHIMDSNYSLPKSFGLEHVVTIRSLPSKAMWEHCCIPVFRGVVGVGMVGLCMFGEKISFAEEGLAMRRKDVACNSSVKQCMT